MANTKAYSIPIGAKNSGQDEDGQVTQSSPAWVLTFVCWNIRDTLRTPNNDPLAVREPLVVENDCLQVNVGFNKGVLTPTMTATLVETNVNYEDSVAPGDFVFVNILNWPSDARRVAIQATNHQPINGINDGFKGVFKIQGVRKTTNADPQTGVRTVAYKINGYAFTEFNNTIYFNPNLINEKNLQNQALFVADIGSAWSNYVSRAGKPAVQEVLAFLIQNIIGVGVNAKARTVGGLVISPNAHFLVPLLVGRLLGVTNDDVEGTTNYKNVVAAKDVYLYLFGLQHYASESSLTLAAGTNPSNLKAGPEYPGFYYTDTLCGGYSILKPEYWNQVTLWSILNQYVNSPLNELYTCFRTSLSGHVMPTVVFRQIPFTSEDFVGQPFGAQDSTAEAIPVTKFLNLPRWSIDSAVVFSADLGRDEAARINFVQYYARSNFTNKGIEMSGETAGGNYVFDKDDIARSGLRPYVAQNQFDDLPDRLILAAPRWARVVGDALIGGHLKTNGTLNCIGIVEPICVGDNAEFNNTVFHIEQVVHQCSIDPSNGIKNFRTILSLSHGVSINSNSQGTVYADMEHPGAYSDRQSDFNNGQILPGVSESQDILGRPTNIDLPHETNVGFVQPALSLNAVKTKE